MRMENGHSLLRKMGTCRSKRGTCRNKRSTSQRCERGKGQFLKINRGTCQSKRGTFLCKKGTSHKVKGALLGTWKSGGGGGGLCSLPATRERHLCLFDREWELFGRTGMNSYSKLTCNAS